MKHLLTPMLLCLSLFAVGQTVTIKFTGTTQSNEHVTLDSVVVTNLTRGWQEVVRYPDTTLILTNNVGIEDHPSSTLLSQNMPNPFNGTTQFSLSLNTPERVQMTLSDIQGRMVAQWAEEMGAGQHRFQVQVSTPQTYLLQVIAGKAKHSIKMINEGSAGQNSIVCIDKTHSPKSSTLQSDKPFVFGDFMEYVGFISLDGNVIESERISIQQGSSQTHTMVFPIDNISDGRPCAGAIVVTDYDGNIYGTVRLGNQCWMAENLRCVHYSDGTTIPFGTTQYTGSQPYRYAPGNDTNNVSYFGYYYNYPAIMHGSSGNNGNPSGIQGICPTGWHLPSSAEWDELASYVGAQSAYQCSNNATSIAKALSTAKDWVQSDVTCATGNMQGTNNATGFSAKPAGGYSGTYNSFGNGCCFWTCTPNSYGYAVGRSWYYNLSTVATTSNGTNNGRSVRCLKN